MARILKDSNFGKVCRVKPEAAVEGVVAADKDYFLVRQGRNNTRIADMVEPGEGILVKTDAILDVRDYAPATPETAPEDAPAAAAAPAATIEVKVEVTVPPAATVEVAAPVVAEAPATQVPAELDAATV
jgi:hypothetical protein